jgi:hypothetical protein
MKIVSKYTAGLSILRKIIRICFDELIEKSAVTEEDLNILMLREK